MKRILAAGTLAGLLVAGGYAAPALSTERAGRSITVNRDDSPVLVGSGTRAQQQRSIAPFTAIEASDASDLVITIGAAQSVRVEADDNLLSHIETTTRNGVLYIRSTGSYSTYKPPVVTITLPSLSGVRMRGSGDARITGIRGGALSLEGIGSGDFHVTGQADTVSAKIKGSGDIDLRALDARDVDAAIYGSGSARVRASHSLRAAVYGSGDIAYSGTAKVDSTVMGNGRISPASN